MGVAFVHDFLTQFGGAERVLLELRKLYPDAPVYTTIYSPDAFSGAFDGVDVRTSWLQRIPIRRRDFRALLPLYPRAVESFDLSFYDLVISSTTSFAKGALVRPGALHVSYMHTPTRFLWREEGHAADVVPRWARPFFAAAVPSLRRWDLAAAKRPTRIVANSHNVAGRIREIYGRDADVIPCPVTLDHFAPSDEPPEHYLVASRFLPYKRVDLAIEACEAMKAPLVIMGDGPDEARLRRLAGPMTRFAGRVSDVERRRLFARALAVIVPGVEDFGLVSIEAAASGRPSVAFAGGGALETIVEGETGIFFREPTTQALTDALRKASQLTLDRSILTSHAKKFAPERFRRDMQALIDRYRTETQPT